MTKNNEEIIKKLPIENTERKLNPSIFKGKGKNINQNHRKKAEEKTEETIIGEEPKNILINGLENNESIYIKGNSKASSRYKELEYKEDSECDNNDEKFTIHYNFSGKNNGLVINLSRSDLGSRKSESKSEISNQSKKKNRRKRKEINY